MSRSMSAESRRSSAGSMRMPVLLHARQHRRQRQFDVFVQLAQAALVDRRVELRPQLERGVAPAPRPRRRACGRSGAASARRASSPTGSASSRKAYSITSWAKPRASMPMRSSTSSADFTSQAIFGRACVFEQRLQPRDQVERHGARLAGAARPGRCVSSGSSPIARLRDRHRHRRARPGSPPATHPPPPTSSSAPIIARARVLARPQFAQQAVELQVLVDLLQQRRVRLLRLHRLQRELDRDIGSRASPAACSCGCARRCSAGSRGTSCAPPRRRARWPPRPSRSARSGPRALVADAGRAGDVVDRVALERQQVGHLRRRPRP